MSILQNQLNLKNKTLN